MDNGEIKTDLIKLEEGQQYTAEWGDCVITEEHTICDVLRYLVGCLNGDREELIYHLEELDK